MMTSSIPFPNITGPDTNQVRPKLGECISATSKALLTSAKKLFSISKDSINHPAAAVQAGPVAATAPVAARRRFNGRTTQAAVSHIAAALAVGLPQAASDNTLLTRSLGTAPPSSVAAELQETDILYLTDEVRRVLKGKTHITKEGLKDLLANLKRIEMIGMRRAEELKVLAGATGFGQALHALREIEMDNSTAEAASLTGELKWQVEKLLSIAESTPIQM
ncbi:hypothetical protein CALVIDRAFT_563884 [Calocera viscosa TUFC12733]|uniref:Uncharacterized protein n=1 Tax=Calocera viscosa (strain TUFC12733) TaxID=1330018 RepID=A0A167M6L3_CALVF|nr:hypothetical protein CALVIDRAFT_563884 [Calocera viscosa TUFC12733]